MWLFDGQSEISVNGDYQYFRDTISAKLGLSAEDVALVGSSKYGFSLNPKPTKTYQPFHEESDLDVVIVGEDLFERTWGAFREAYYNGYSWIKARHESDVFRRFVLLLPEENYKTVYLRSTSRLMDEMAVEVGQKTGINRKLKYRIYADWEAALNYYTHGLEKLQRSLNHDTQ
tara:strand:+ start:1943 stop:2461 length:519 start_codon:yes stop_codon:yes gene_type:complete